MNKFRLPAHQMDMLHGGLLKKLLLFALPLAVSSILQQLFNAVDVAVVGHFASSEAQAAVGCTGPVINLMINLFVGISVGANVVVSRYVGQKETRRIHVAVHTAMVLALLCGGFLLVLGVFTARPILTAMDTPGNILDQAALYLGIYFLGMPFLLVYNFGAAILRSVGDTNRPLWALVLSGLLNAGLNLLLVIVFHLGAAGVAIATVTSNFVSASMVWVFLSREDGPLRLTWRDLALSGPELRLMLQIGLPAGLQGMVFSVTNVFIQTALNSFGSAPVAGSAITLNYEYMTYFVISAFNQTVLTFLSQNFGAGQYDRCRKIFRLCLLLSMAFTACLSFTILAFHGFFISLFTADPVVAEFAAIRMTYLLTFNFIASTYEVGGAALRGIGYSMTPAVITVFGTCIFRLLWVFLVCPLSPAFETLLLVYPLSWFLTGGVVLAAYGFLQRRAFSSPAQIDPLPPISHS